MATTSEARLAAAIEKAFGKIGYTNGTMPPIGGDNLDPILHEGFVSSLLAHLAGKRWDEWKKKLDDDLRSGASTSNYAMVVKQNNPSEVVNVNDFEAELRKLGVSADVLITARERATKIRAGATRITIGVL